ncbi:MAG: GNAT family N-acetyltransferase [Blastocatellia bacterium]|nr:GNAT family N-acetyltransferase [Blastocatellia bacterium]MCS7156328.1 GNAT family N-acetyltransferase [Blastocatellia bacterium]MDW8169034.1 GNAT family N-acetyltransferase [Acidobacteriota bacterium]MDW8256394.1 GNAT family N-acetyltransferase [Acidobacteriota bacterium]
MPVLSLASSDEMRAILAETHVLWGEGMQFDDYLAFVWAQMESPWGRENFRYLVWKEGALVLSSLKLYRLHARCGSRHVILGGIGAVYTPRAHRGHGHARAMLAAVLERLRAEGVHGALLFSDIGTAYYQRLGFRPLPSHEFVVPLAAIPVREGSLLEVERIQDADWSDVERLYERATASDPFVLSRSPTYWAHWRQKEQERMRHLPAGMKSPRHWIARREGESVGYALTVVEPPTLVLKELIVADEAQETAEALLAAIRRDGEALGAAQLIGWWPPLAWSRFLVSEHIRPRPRVRELTMMASLDPTFDVERLTAWGDLFWGTDHF